MQTITPALCLPHLSKISLFVLSLFHVTEYRLRVLDGHEEGIKNSLLKDPTSKSLPSILLVVDTEYQGRPVKTVKDVLEVGVNYLK